MRKIRLGISSCLLGNPVRYDGQHQRNAFLCDVLGPLVDYVPVCPEVECGLPVPRESMRLVGDPAAPRLVTNFTGRDLTDQMNSWVKHRLDELATADLDGFVFKKDSPSSGLERVKVFNAKGAPVKTGRGLFAGAFIAALLIGQIHNFGAVYLPWAATVLPFMLMVRILIWRPTGFAGSRT